MHATPDQKKREEIGQIEIKKGRKEGRNQTNRSILEGKIRVKKDER